MVPALGRAVNQEEAELAFHVNGIPPLLLSVRRWVAWVFAAIDPKPTEGELTLNTGGDTVGDGVTGG